MSFRTRFFGMSLSRFAQASTVALIALVLAGAARADTIKDFVVSGTALNVSGGSLGSCIAGARCSFSGTMMVDVTAGSVTAYEITFPGLAPFDDCCTLQGHGGGSVWIANSRNNAIDTLFLNIYTTHTPASLVGFDGGFITGSVNGPDTEALYRPFSGSITPVPEPSSLALLGAGLLPVIGVIRRRYLNR